MPRGEVVEYVLSVFDPVKAQVPDIGIRGIVTALVAQPVIGVVNVIGQMVHASTVCFLRLGVNTSWMFRRLLLAEYSLVGPAN